MQKLKNAIKGHRHGDRADEAGTYETGVGGSSYETATGMDAGMLGTTGVTGAHTSQVATGEVVSERPVAVGVAEVPVVVTEQERRVETAAASSEEVCGQKTFTEVEDRPVVRERVERIVEHRPVEKQYVVETRFVGEKEMGTAGAEIVDIKDRVVDVAEPGPRCPVGTGAIINETAAGMGLTGQGAAGTGHHHHTHGTGVTDTRL